jgi:hypothetical protein
MYKIPRNRYTILLLFAITSQVFAQSDSLSRTKKIRITPLPVLYYSPETRFGFGALVAASFNSSYDSLTTASYAQTYILYTANKQYDWGNKLRYYSPQNKFIFEGKFSFTYFPEFYYGVETEEPLSKKDTISYNKLTGDLRFFWRVNKSLYAGFAVRYNKIYKVDSPEGGNFLIDQPLGYQGYELIGFAPALTYESRDSQTYPRKGIFTEVSVMPYPKWSDNTTGFINVRIDARKYIPLKLISDRDVLALQAFLNLNSGDVPFKDMADIGGGNVMRGYYTGYYRYNNLYAFQAEFRAGLWRFIGIDAWIGGAFTPKDWYSIGDTSIKPNAGLGLRVMINQKDKLNVRVDQGFGKQKQQGFYLDIAEAY